MFWRKKEKTKIIVQYDAGFPNTLYVRGEGIPELNWQKGTPLKNVKANEWVFETQGTIKEGQFKILINDKVYEQGSNHRLHGGSSVRINPTF